MNTCKQQSINSFMTEILVVQKPVSRCPFHYFHPLTDTQTLAGLQLHRAHHCPQLVAEIEHGTLDTRFLEFCLSTLALVAAVVRRMLKTRVTLGNISCVLLNLFKRLIFAMFKESSPSQCSCSYYSYFFFSSTITATSHFNFCSRALSVQFVSYVYSVGKSLFMGRLRIALVFLILTIAHFISESLLGKSIHGGSIGGFKCCQKIPVKAFI